MSPAETVDRLWTCCGITRGSSMGDSVGSSMGGAVASFMGDAVGGLVWDTGKVFEAIGGGFAVEGWGK